jgi:DNA polymerase-3 subunit gamma/tau
MNKLALYRKYRPKEFEEVLGQDHIVGILKNAVKAGRVSHAYLLSGPRGTGKTSVARILAKEIGCSDIDLLEIDAASSRGIDEIRALRDAVHFVPLQGKVKVYIIDEVHMLTKEAFNALL